MQLSKKDLVLIIALFLTLALACTGGWMAYANAGLKQQIKQLQLLNRDYQAGIDRLRAASARTQAQAQRYATAFAADTLQLVAIRYSFDSLAHRVELIKISNYAKIQTVTALGNAATDSLYAINRAKFNP